MTYFFAKSFENINRNSLLLAVDVLFSDTDYVMVLGGVFTYTDVELVDFSEHKNMTLPKPANLPEAMHGSVAALVKDQVIACGGSGIRKCFIYDFALNKWDPTVSLDIDRWGAASFVFRDDWYILGGEFITEGSSPYLDTTIIYRNGNFETGQKLPSPAFYPCVVPVNGTHVFYAGGYEGPGGKSDAYLLEVAIWKWTRLDDMVYGRYQHSCGKAGSDIVVVGGCCSNLVKTTSEIFSLETMYWTSGPAIPQTPDGSLSNAAVAQFENTFFILGGLSGNTRLDSVFEFDAMNIVWKKRKEKLSTGKFDHAVVAIPNRLLHPGK